MISDSKSEEIQEILSEVPSVFIRTANISILFIIFIFISGMWFIKYPDIIYSEAIITTQIPPQKEYAKISAKIDTLLVADNEKVISEQPLAILENNAEYKDVLFLKSIIDTLSEDNSSFYFPIDRIPILSLGDIESDFAIFESDYIQYTLNKELQPFSNTILANRLTVSELSRRLANLNAQKLLNLSELKFKKKDLDRSKTLFEKGVISAVEYENNQLEYIQAERDSENINISMSQIKEALNTASTSIKGTRIDQTKEKLVLQNNVVQSFNQLKKSIKDWELRYLLKSNIDGYVSFLNIWNENQQVSQGDLVFTIIPSANSSYIAKLKAPAFNSGKINVGQKVNIKLENYPYPEFGVLRGKVAEISSIFNAEGYYLIDVNLPQNLITSYNEEIEFKQEMSGVAEIITEDLRLIDRILYKFKEVLKR